MNIFNEKRFFLLSMILLGHCTASFAAQESKDSFDNLWEEAQLENAFGREEAIQYQMKKYRNPKTYADKENKCSLCLGTIAKKNVRKPCTRCNVTMCKSCLYDTRIAVYHRSTPNSCGNCRQGDCYENFDLLEMNLNEFGHFMKKSTEYVLDNLPETQVSCKIWSCFDKEKKFGVQKPFRLGIDNLNSVRLEALESDNIFWVPMLEFNSTVAVSRLYLNSEKNNKESDNKKIISIFIPYGHSSKYAQEAACFKINLKKYQPMLKASISNPQLEIESSALDSPHKKWIRLAKNRNGLSAIRADHVESEGYKCIWAPQGNNCAIKLAIPKDTPLQQGMEEVATSKTWKPHSNERPHLGIKKDSNN